MLKLFSVPVLAACLAASLRAEVKLPGLFADHAVFQQGVPVPIWGTAEPGEAVTVEFAGQSKTTIADASGKWSVRLDPLRASSVPAELDVKSQNSNLKATDILVGEVWLCGGQSNMQFPLSKSNGGPEAAAAADLPLIRVFRVWQASAQQPSIRPPGKWSVCSPSTAGGYTAVGFYFARDIQPKIGVPVGLLQCAVGGTAIEAWMSGETFQANAFDEFFAKALERHKKFMEDYAEKRKQFPGLLDAWKKERGEAAAAGREFTKPEPGEPKKPEENLSLPMAFYNGMLHPLIPYAIRGALWYQGETNLGRDAEYAKFFPALIRQWRKEWGQGDFPFYFVQLPFYNGPIGVWAGFRATQAKALSEPNTGMAVSLDLGDMKDIHPKDKLEVGERLARIALHKTYGKTEVEFSGPLLEKIERDGSSLRLTFSHAGGLAMKGEEARGFEIAGEDKKFRVANAVIEGGQIVLSSSFVPNPVHASCGWNYNDTLPPNIYNDSGLLITPFRSSLEPEK